MQINCSSDWQWELASNGDVEFDADIVGPGVVIASFIAAALTAFFTLILGFTTYSIPTELINDVDGIVIRALRTLFASLRTRLHLPSITQTDGEEGHEDRLRAFQSFMLSVSDQVLVSNMAILIATFVKYADITLYSVNVIIALGCVASTVHLAMMPLLVQSMREHHIIKASRCLSMVAGAIMLVILLLLQASDTWRDAAHIYFRCALRDFHINKGYDLIGLLTQFLVIVSIIYGNCEVIWLLFSKSRGNDISAETKDALHENKEDETPRKAHSIGTRFRKACVNMGTRQQSHIRRQWVQYEARRAIGRKTSLRKQQITTLLIAEKFVFHECQDSFVWRIMWLLGANIYGVIEVFMTRSNTSGMSGDRDTMGYGQIVPLVLLILPLFAAIQSVYDYRDRIEIKKEAIQTTNQQNDILESPTEVTASPESFQPDSINADDNCDGPGHLLSTPATPAHLQTPSTTPQRQDSAPSTSIPSLNEHEILDVFRSATLEPFDARDQTPPSGIHRPLWHLARGGEYTEMPCVRAFVYMHTVLMFLSMVLFGWTMADGPIELVVVMYASLTLVFGRSLAGSVLFLLFASRQREELARQGPIHTSKTLNKPAADPVQRMMHTQAVNELPVDETES
ncbi:hypothetical protein BJX76DRAFT_358621 [Aspergillus varians]